jgi:hypothetical protein
MESADKIIVKKKNGEMESDGQQVGPYNSNEGESHVGSGGTL